MLIRNLPTSRGRPQWESVQFPDQVSPYLSIVVPVWNGGARLRETLESLDAAVGKYGFAAEIIIVDDGSDGETMAEIERFQAERPTRVLRNAENRGKGYSVARGMLAATGQYRVFTDADLAYPACEIEKVLRALEDGSDVAIGCRMHPESRSVICPRAFPYFFVRHVMSRAFNLLVRAFLMRGVLDSQAGLKGFTQAAAELIFSRLTVPRFGFDLECLYIARQHALRLAQIPVTYRHDDEESSVRVPRDGTRMLRDLARVRLNAWRGCYR